MSEEIPIKFVIMDHAKGLSAPYYATAEAAGMDVVAALDMPLTIAPNERCAVPTGLMMEIPPGYEIQIRPRSSLALKQGLTVLNTPGTIDSDYRGEVKVILINLGADDITIERGQRIAQMVLAPVIRGRFIRAETLNSTSRGGGGFGSTGA